MVDAPVKFQIEQDTLKMSTQALYKKEEKEKEKEKEKESLDSKERRAQKKRREGVSHTYEEETTDDKKRKKKKDKKKDKKVDKSQKLASAEFVGSGGNNKIRLKIGHS